MKMRRVSAIRLQERLLGSVGLRLSAKVSDDALVLMPLDEDPRQSFTLTIRNAAAHLEAMLRLGSYAGNFLEQLSRSSRDERSRFGEIAQTAIAAGMEVALVINGQECPTGDSTDWPEVWNYLELDLARRRLPVADLSDEALEDEVVRLAVTGLRLLLALAANVVEFASDEADCHDEGLPEGAWSVVRVNRYERNRRNRQMCIEYHGAACQACGIALLNVYGEIARGLVHVHHVVPVSRLGKDYVVNPRTDLVPLCPNCHAVIHRHDPPLSVEELKRLLRQR